MRILARVGADLSLPAVLDGEELPPVALCPTQKMVAVLESLGTAHCFVN